MLSSASTPIAVRVSIVAAPMCGSRNVFFKVDIPDSASALPRTTFRRRLHLTSVMT
jgi:hypothetical protein